MTYEIDIEHVTVWRRKIHDHRLYKMKEFVGYQILSQNYILFQGQFKGEFIDTSLIELTMWKRYVRFKLK